MSTLALPAGSGWQPGGNPIPSQHTTRAAPPSDRHAPSAVPYTTSKVRLRGIAKAFAAELAKHHIRVNSVHPTGVNTPMGTGDMQAVLGKAIEGDPRLGPMFTNLLPVEGTEPEDVADTALFLASDESRYITAHEIAPDAGVTEF
jgi:NAD(P)-dependent dehydrogenase (short-subunit alcohol dehydrogenase family)